MKKSLLAVILVATLTLTACSAAWVTTVDTIISVAGPALINILEIVAVSKGVPVNAALVAKVNTDVTNVKTLVGDFAKASTTAAPGVCSQLQAAISTYQADQVTILSTAQVVDTNTQTKITLLSNLVAGTVTGILAAIPSCQPPAAGFRATAPLDVKNFVVTYNAVLTTKTGDQAVDAVTGKMKLHEHSKFARFVTLGALK